MIAQLGRRSFLSGLVALVAAPAVVHSRNLMPISAAKLWTPPTTLVGTIRPNVGVVPDGWLPCDGRWVVTRDYPSLFAILGNKYGANNTNPFGMFFLPDMTAQVHLDRQRGKEVGRYVIFAGDERRKHKEKIDHIVATMTAVPAGIPDKFHTIDWSRT